MNTRERLTQAAVSRFYRDGFRNVGIDQILDDVGISKTAFYKHFTSKDELMLAALEMQNEWVQNSFREMIHKGGRVAVDQLRALFDAVEQIVGQDGFHGCIFVNAAIEFPLPHTPVHQLSARNKQAIFDIVYEIAERSGAADPKRLAEELCMIMDATYVGRVVTNSSSVIETARGLAERVIESHLGVTTGREPNARLGLRASRPSQPPGTRSSARRPPRPVRTH